MTQEQPGTPAGYRLCLECGRRAYFQIEPDGEYDGLAYEPAPACRDDVATLCSAQIEQTGSAKVTWLVPS